MVNKLTMPSAQFFIAEYTVLRSDTKGPEFANNIIPLIREHVEREEAAITGSAQGSEHLSLLLLGDIQYGCARHSGAP
jgi:hypothetical protein